MTAEATIGIILASIGIVVLLIGLSGIRVVYQYERVVIFILGRLISAKGPGVFWVPPLSARPARLICGW
jgi:regulator of protease activity HflC (stomatin/prohibitin superfamily)